MNLFSSFDSSYWLGSSSINTILWKKVTFGLDNQGDASLSIENLFFLYWVKSEHRHWHRISTIWTHPSIRKASDWFDQTLKNLVFPIGRTRFNEKKNEKHVESFIEFVAVGNSFVLRCLKFSSMSSIVLIVSLRTVLDASSFNIRTWPCYKKTTWTDILTMYFNKENLSSWFSESIKKKKFNHFYFIWNYRIFFSQVDLGVSTTIPQHIEIKSEAEEYSDWLEQFFFYQNNFCLLRSLSSRRNDRERKKERKKISKQVLVREIFLISGSSVELRSNKTW